MRHFAENGAIMGLMKPTLQPPTRPDGTPFPNLDSLFRAVIAVPKEEIDKREAEWQKAHGKKRRTKKTS